MGKLELATVGIFTSQKAANAAKKDWLPPTEGVVKNLRPDIVLESEQYED